MPLSELTLVEATRRVTSELQTERRFLDFAIDTQPLYPTVLANELDYISTLWLDGGEWCHGALRRLLGEAEADAPDGRVCVYVCPECADLGCGAITVLIERRFDTVSWREWGYQNNYDKGIVELVGFHDVSFDATQYESVLRAALSRLRRDSAELPARARVRTRRRR